MKTTFNYEQFNTMPLIGILRNAPLKDLDRLLDLYAAAGLTTLEITLNSPGSLKMIEHAASRLSGTLNIGAGTVCSQADLKAALDAGAEFIVTPIVNEAVIAACAQQAVPIFPGAMTATEIYTAWQTGATMVKVFPASTLGPGHFSQILGPLNHVKLLATGGISLENMNQYWAAGARGFGIGSPLFIKQMIVDRHWQELSAHFKAFAHQLKTLLES